MIYLNRSIICLVELIYFQRKIVIILNATTCTNLSIIIQTNHFTIQEKKKRKEKEHLN
jgi:hypothetical protein